MSATGQAAGATLRLLQTQVAEIRKKARSDERMRSIGFHVAAPWSGGVTLRVEGEELPLSWCPSTLAFRDELGRHERAGRQAVLLTDRSGQELGLDVLARLARRRLHSLDAWQALFERLGVREVHPRLRQLRWLPDHLLEVWPEDMRPSTPVLDVEEVWQVLLGRLGLSDPRPDLRALLDWTTAPERLALFAALPPEARAAYADRLALTAGDAGVAILRLVSAHPRPLGRERERGEQGESSSLRGGEAVAAGLVCEVLFASGAAADRAVGRFEERLLGGAVLDVEAGRAWAAAASELVRHRRDAQGEAAVVPWLAQAGQLFTELNIEPLARESSWLPAGFERRTVDFAEALNAWLDHLDTAQRFEPERLEPVAAAVKRIEEHGLKPDREAETSSVEMMLRLSRYLGASRIRRAPHPPAPPPRTHIRPGEGEHSPATEGLAAAATSYAREGSFVDLARTSLAGAPLAGSLGVVRDRLFRAVTERREAENRRFAELLARWSGEGEDEAGVPLESVLDRVVAPVASVGPVLLLVLDGLSFAVFRELAADLGKRGWEELRPEGTVARLCGVGLFPTVTEICRTSLLCGARRTGDAATEKQGFQEHPGLRRQGTASHTPVLFHKRDLTGGGLGLAPDVKTAIEQAGRRVVGIVLNVVDDQLPRGGQLLPRWEVGAMRHLDEILQIARGAGRTVVIVADHGHVIERETELRRHEGGGARHRPAGPSAEAPGEGEILVSSPRVLAGDGQVILAWSERLRYAMIAGGYHGGASPQEVIVPLSVWVPFDTTLSGWEPAGDDTPAWWQGEAAPAAPVVRPSRPAGKSRPKGTPQTQGQLFAAPVDWLDALFAAPAYREQLRQFGGRQGMTDETIRAVLQALDQRGGRLTLPALARQLGLSLGRGQLLLAALQRVLNVDGFGVLSFEPESGSIVLDRGLLETQLLRGGEE